ncbi:MAG TPA: hypothetical protein PLQ54_18630, partial [Armatimonadota bacterium]|nr:hypothetical protein [Armatimonadota bacterium]
MSIQVAAAGAMLLVGTILPAGNRNLAGPTETAMIALEVGMTTPEEPRQQASEAEERVIVPPSDPIGPMWDLGRFGQAPMYEEATGYQWAETSEGVRPIFFDGPEYRGRPTRVFAWLGVPDAPPGTRLPGMVLVPGGGGTAFAHWVK